MYTYQYKNYYNMYIHRIPSVPEISINPIFHVCFLVEIMGPRNQRVPFLNPTSKEPRPCGMEPKRPRKPRSSIEVER